MPRGSCEVTLLDQQRRGIRAERVSGERMAGQRGRRGWCRGWSEFLRQPGSGAACWVVVELTRVVASNLGWRKGGPIARVAELGTCRFLSPNVLSRVKGRGRTSQGGQPTSAGAAGEERGGDREAQRAIAACEMGACTGQYLGSVSNDACILGQVLAYRRRGGETWNVCNSKGTARVRPTLWRPPPGNPCPVQAWPIETREPPSPFSFSGIQASCQPGRPSPPFSSSSSPPPPWEPAASSQPRVSGHLTACPP